MPPDFLPLEVGNVWEYQITDEEGRPVDEFRMEVTEHSIVDAMSFYLFSQFPFEPEGTLPQPVAIRYDGGQRQFFHFDGRRLAELFPSLGASADVLENDAAGLPLTVRFDFGTLVLRLERGLGIVGAELETIDGVRMVSLVGARVGGEVVLEAEPARSAGVVAASGANPERPDTEGVVDPSEPVARLQLEAVPEGDGHRFLLRILNASNSLLGFDFDSSQNFDFIVTDPELGREVWRWSRRMFFSQVIRSEAIRPGGEWSFEAVWNYRDNNLDEVTPGTYQILGVLTADTPLEAGPIAFEVP